MNTLITVLVVIAAAALVFAAVRYIIKEKKKGSRCVGCPYAGSCTKYGDGDHSVHGSCH